MVTRLNRYNGQRAAVRGLTRVGVLAVLACIALSIIVCVLPGLNRERDYAQGMACASNVKELGLAFRDWESDHGDKYPGSYFTNADGRPKYADGSNVFHYFQVITNALSNELDKPIVLHCPSDVRNPATDFAHLKSENISYFIGLDADEMWPAMLLSGDRNLVTNGVDVVPGLVVIRPDMKVDWSAKMHNLTGNFGLADGSVQKGSTRTFQMFINNAGTNMIRLAVP